MLSGIVRLIVDRFSTNVWLFMLMVDWRVVKLVALPSLLSFFHLENPGLLEYEKIELVSANEL